MSRVALLAAVSTALVGCGSDGTALVEGSPGTVRAGDTYISKTIPISDDPSAVARLPSAKLPAKVRPDLRRLIEMNHAGRPLLAQSRQLLETHGRRLYLVPTSRGWLCDVLVPPGISDCSGLHLGRPQLYPYYMFDNGRAGQAGKVVVFGLVPDRIRKVSVRVRCRPHPAVLAFNGFYYELTGARVNDVNGFFFTLTDGKVDRQFVGHC